MASAFSHALVAVALGKGVLHSRRAWGMWGVYLLGMLCAVLPDIDVIGFHYGIPYAHVLGHRGISHSLAFAALLALLLTAILLRFHSWRGHGGRVFTFLFLATASHGVLDAMTTGGLGVAFFAPFDNERYFFALRPIQVSPLSVRLFFEESALRVLRSEMLWIWLPSLAAITIVHALQRLLGARRAVERQ